MIEAEPGGDGGDRGVPVADDASTLPGDAAVADAGAVDDGAADAGPADAGEPDTRLVDFVAGTRVVDNVLNIVDSSAANELENFLSSGQDVHSARVPGLDLALSHFLSLYEEVYDFVFVFNDHTLIYGPIAKFEAITRKAAPGGVNEVEIEAYGYSTTGRLRAAIGVQWGSQVGEALAHAILHEWAAYLDQTLGFDWRHWGFTSVHGQLGGFDRSSLRCETPAGATPPGCTPLASGRTRYVLTKFSRSSNPLAPYVPLELYMMGLVPPSDVPASFQRLDEAVEVADSYDPVTGTIVVEADSVSEVTFADIVARHGLIEPLAEQDRSFRAAFVVVSAAPATDEVMADVAEWAAAFGNRGASELVTPFETLTGNRATLDTELGPRRTNASAIARPWRNERFECDLLAQDCPRPELGCFWGDHHDCALSGGVAEGEICAWEYACAPGLGCHDSRCTPYCNPDDDSAELACARLCPGSEGRFEGPLEHSSDAICLP